MRRKVTLVDYGLGNLRAFQNIYSRLNFDIEIAASPETIQAAKVIILPGVGSFDWAITKLNRSGLRTALEDKVMGQKTPFLGVCVGMQLLADSSEEGQLPGLGWIPGKVKKIDAKSRITGDDTKLVLPHMGWNTVRTSRASLLFPTRHQDTLRFYFLHSYYYETCNSDHALAETEYGISFTSVVGENNIFGVQFHPEKSHRWGAQLLKTFADLC